MNRKGQSGLEYGVFFTMCVLALATMTPYARRCISGMLKKSSTEISEKHYDPYHTNGQSKMEYIDNSSSHLTFKGLEQTGAAQSRQSGNENLDKLQ